MRKNTACLFLFGSLLSLSGMAQTKRDSTGGCPVETMCSEVESAEEILPLIRDFLEKIRNKK